MLIVAYIRVSTQKQSDSGLGQEAQEAAVQYYAKANSAEIIATFSEVESGGRRDRPELQKAIDRCKQTGATLVVAKIDRLARDLAFLTWLLDSKIQFLACDNPHANRLTLQILGVMGEWERGQTAIRTKDALAAAKARGVKLGAHNPKCRNLTPEAQKAGQAAGAAARRAKAESYYESLRSEFETLRHLTYEQGAVMLNTQHIKNAAGKPWNSVQVGRVLKRLFPVVAQS